MSAKHTPGPWNLETGWSISGPNRCEIARAIQPELSGDVENVEQQLANAALIAAAPKLLEALKGLVDGHASYWEKAEKAIAQAEGRS